MLVRNLERFHFVNRTSGASDEVMKYELISVVAFLGLLLVLGVLLIGDAVVRLLRK